MSFFIIAPQHSQTQMFCLVQIFQNRMQSGCKDMRHPNHSWQQKTFKGTHSRTTDSLRLMKRAREFSQHRGFKYILVIIVMLLWWKWNLLQHHHVCKSKQTKKKVDQAAKQKRRECSGVVSWQWLHSVTFCEQRVSCSNKQMREGKNSSQMSSCVITVNPAWRW